ncbi:MAG: hypothetical protein CM1200mP26_09330 [Acidimicrobiales bacterium]|nr:MAG: hypothetical protein CM1200mP26_09330 [Acidimicrobiales bacterium]
MIEALPRLGMALVLLYGGHLAIDGQIGVGSLLAFSGYVTMIAMPFRMFGFVLIQAQRAAASSLRIYEIFDEEPAIVDRPGAREPTLDSPDLGRVEFRDVVFDYPSTSRLSGDSTGSTLSGGTTDIGAQRLQSGDRAGRDGGHRRSHGLWKVDRRSPSPPVLRRFVGRRAGGWHRRS